MDKIVSLAPNITDIIVDLDMENKIVACTSHSDLRGCKEIGDWLSPDYKRLRDFDPDIVMTSDPLQQDIKNEIENMGYNTLHTEPTRFSDLTDLIQTIGETIDADERSDQLIDNVVRRYHKVKESSTSKEATVYCEEWDTPPMAAGNWIPDMVDAVGGSYPFVQGGDRSTSITEDQFKQQKPDYFISHLCGQGKMTNFRSIRDNWSYDGDVYFVEDQYMNRLSTKTVIGLEIICEIVCDEDFGHSQKYCQMTPE